MFGHLKDDIVSRTGITSDQADRLLRALTARLLHNEQGGLAGLLADVRTRDEALVTAWLGDDPKSGTITPSEVDEVLGAGWSNATADSIGISVDAVRSGTSVALPVVLDTLTPGGMIPAAEELERSYAGWAGGPVVRPVSFDEPPMADFPSRPGETQFVEMNLEEPAAPIKAKAIDGPATLLPWVLLFVILPIVLVVTWGMGPKAGEHGSSHAESGHSVEGGEPAQSIGE